MDCVGNDEIVDLIGIGIGPFNLGLASLLKPINNFKAKFFETRDQFVWHEGILLEDCNLQVPFMADLVTMCDPTSPYSFLNYLNVQGRLYQFYFYEKFQIPRAEYNRYCQWVSHQLDSLHFAQEIVDVRKEGALFCVSARDTKTGNISFHLAKNIVLGVGTNPNLPPSLAENFNNCDFIHSSQYTFAKPSLQKKHSITVIGGGQSAAECFLDLLRDQERFGYELNWLTRSSGFFPMEYSKLGLEHFSPDYIEHFFELPAAKRGEILSKQSNWYKGISFSTIAEIYDCLYVRSIASPLNVILQARSELRRARKSAEGWSLEFHHTELQQRFHVASEAVICGSGYRYQIPQCIDGILHLIEFESEQQPVVQRDYTLKTKSDAPGHIFVQNGELHTHGIAAPDLGLGAYRNATIINRLLGKQHYSTSTKTVFQSFGIAERWQNNVASSQRPLFSVGNIHENVS